MQGDSRRVVFMVAGGDYDEKVRIPTKITSSLEGNAFISTFTNLVDSHLYIMKRWLLDYVFHKKYVTILLERCELHTLLQLVLNDSKKHMATFVIRC